MLRSRSSADRPRLCAYVGPASASGLAKVAPLPSGSGSSIPSPAGGLRVVGLSFIGLLGLDPGLCLDGGALLHAGMSGPRTLPASLLLPVLLNLLTHPTPPDDPSIDSAPLRDRRRAAAPSQSPSLLVLLAAAVALHRRCRRFRRRSRSCRSRSCRRCRRSPQCLPPPPLPLSLRRPAAPSV